MNRVDGKVCVVTGGTQGLGAAVARALAEAGAEAVVTAGRNAERGRAIAEGIGASTGVPVRFVQADLARVEEARAVVQAADGHFGRVDVLVNAAGLTDRGDILSTTPDLFDRLFAVNVRAPFFLMQEAIRVMLRVGSEGSIVNVGSMASQGGQPFISPYCASKGALATLTRNTAFAVLRNRIRVNQLDVGWMSTDGEDRVQREQMGEPEGWAARAGAALPFGRLVDPHEAARAAVFLASDDSGLMTGAVIPLDQSVRGAWASVAPTPEGPLTLAS